MRFVLLTALLIVLALPVAASAQATPPVFTRAGSGAGSAQASAPAGGLDAGPITNLKFSGLAQMWYQAGDEGFVDTFRLRRLRLYISGNVTPRARFMVMVDPSKALDINQDRVTLGGSTVVDGVAVNQGTRILQDAYFALRLASRLEVQVGQFKLPMNFEGSAPLQELPVVERSLITSDRSRGGRFGDLRDVGVMARGEFANLEYRLGVFNELGSSQNDVDRDDGKAVAGRLTYRTPVRGLRVGGFGAWDGAAAPDVVHRRAGLDAGYERGRLRLTGELAAGRDGEARRRGYFGTVSWRVRPVIDLTARLDVFDPDTRFDTSRADVAERDYIGAVSYYVSGNNVKCQAEYLRKTYRAAIAPSQHVLLTSLQLAW
jgi:hypothetical protein